MYATDVAREVDEKYIQTGLIKFVHWDLPLSSHGYPAIVGAEASHCAGDQGAYWEMHYGLYDNWKALSELDTEDEQAAVEAVLELTGDLVDDPEALARCVEEQKYRPVVATMLRQALDMEVNVTPAFLIQSTDPNGNDHVEPMLGFLPYDEFSALLDQEISRAQGTPIPTRTPEPTPDPSQVEDEAADEEAGEGGESEDAAGDEG